VTAAGILELASAASQCADCRGAGALDRTVDEHSREALCSWREARRTSSTVLRPAFVSVLVRGADAVVVTPFVSDPSPRDAEDLLGAGLDAGFCYALAGSQISWEISRATSVPCPLARASTTPVTAQMTLLSHR